MYAHGTVCISVDDAKLLHLFPSTFTHVLDFIRGILAVFFIVLIFMNSLHVQFIMSKVIALFSA